MISDLRRLVAGFDRRDRLELLLYVAVQFGLGVLDLVGIAAVYPLMQTLTGASLDTGTLGSVHRMLGSPPKTEFVVLLAALMSLAFLVKAVLMSWALWWSAGLLVRLQTRTSERILRSFLTEDYLTHRRRDTGEVLSAVGMAVQSAHINVLGGALAIISSAMSVGLITAFLLALMPGPTIAAAVYFAVVVLLLQRVLAPANRRAGVQAQQAAWATSKALVDAVTGFREVRMHDAAEHFVDRFHTSNVAQAQAARRANFLGVVPKQILELVTMIGIALLVVWAVLSHNEGSALPTLSLLVAATVKLLPMMVAFTVTIGNIRVGREGLAITVRTLDQLPPETRDVDEGDRRTLAHRAAIELSGVSFRYPDADREVISGIDLRIPQGRSVALCGLSGSGKTTLVDIILGLIPPTSGTVTYDDVPTALGGHAWHDAVAYVPQDVHITNDTIAANIAFGLDPSDWDDARIAEAVERAELTEVVDALPEGLHTRLGERGSRLSGGQRQRIGLARALYRRPRIIVLDEATSALDNETEHRITQTVRELRGEITTIIVAHRLSSVRHVDHLVFLAAGRIEAQGSFTDVVRSSRTFARLVELGRLDDETVTVAPGSSSGDA